MHASICKILKIYIHTYYVRVCVCVQYEIKRYLKRQLQSEYEKKEDANLRHSGVTRGTASNVTRKIAKIMRRKHIYSVYMNM